MKTSMITIKTDPKVKKEIQIFSENVGVSLSALTNAMYKKIIRERVIDLSDVYYVPNKKTAREIKQAEKDFRAGKNISPVFDNADDMVAYLRKETK